MEKQRSEKSGHERQYEFLHLSHTRETQGRRGLAGLKAGSGGSL
jgi:hypothetical protein